MAAALVVLGPSAISAQDANTQIQIEPDPTAAQTDAGVVSERKRLNERLLDTAALIQRSESQLTAIEKRLVELEAQDAATRADLNARHGQISKLLAALQRMGRNPPPVMVTGRKDALGMVRSAILLSSAFPQLKEQATTLSTRLNDLAEVMADTRAESARLRAETERLNEARTRLASLMNAKKQSLAEHQAQISDVRAATADVSRNAQSLGDLIDKLDRTVVAKTDLGRYQAERAASTGQPIVVAAVKSPAETDAPPPADDNFGAPPPPAAAPSGRSIMTITPGTSVSVPAPAAAAKPIEVAAVQAPDLKPPIIELAPQNAAVVSGSPGRMKPAIPFASARGKLPIPAHGSVILEYGGRTQFGGRSKGMVLETRHDAQITSPSDGWVVWAGEFRSYGQLLIINAGDGYHLLLAGMSQIDVEPGQFVLASEPVGTMASAAKTASASLKSGLPVLYIEFRKDGRPIDPEPWWATGQQKVQG